MKKYVLLSWVHGDHGYEWYSEPFIIEAEDRLSAKKIAENLASNNRYMVVELPDNIKTVNSEGFVD